MCDELSDGLGATDALPVGVFVDPRKQLVSEADVGRPPHLGATYLPFCHAAAFSAFRMWSQIRLAAAQAAAWVR